LTPHANVAIVPGVDYFPGFLDRVAQEALRDEVLAILKLAPPFRPRMPRTGKPFSVLMSNCGPLGWVSDERGYRYQATHPETGRPWPAMPPTLLIAFAALAPGAPPPEACLINLYDPAARMGLHQDRDEEELAAPVVSFSLSRRRASTQCADPLLPPRFGRRDVAGGREPSRVPRRRPHHRRLFDPPASGRKDQSNASARDEGERVSVGYSPLDAGSCLGAAFGPPLETPTMAGRRTRSPIVQPLCTTWETVPEGTVSSGASKIAW
jgi:DNA alkylation damage repair protein AlkB